MTFKLYKNKKLETFMQAIIVITSLIGLILNFRLFNSIKGLLYYTVLSNIYVFLFYLYSIILKMKKHSKKNDIYYCLKGLVLQSILCTMIVYNFLIVPFGEIAVYVNNSLECNIVHLVVPLMVLLECLLFEDKRVLKYKYIIYWVIPTVIYMIFLMTYSKLGGLFLDNSTVIYPFLDFNNNGYMAMLLISIIYIVTGFLIIFIDNKMKESLGGKL